MEAPAAETSICECDALWLLVEDSRAEDPLALWVAAELVFLPLLFFFPIHPYRYIMALKATKVRKK